MSSRAQGDSTLLCDQQRIGACGDFGQHKLNVCLMSVIVDYWPEWSAMISWHPDNAAKQDQVALCVALANQIEVAGQRASARAGYILYHVITFLKLITLLTFILHSFSKEAIF